jgi:hypothetical protein
LYQQGFLIPAPDAPWIECLIVDVSDSGVRLEVGALAGAGFLASPSQPRGPSGVLAGLVQGRTVGAGFIGAKELWKDFEATAEPRLQQVSSSYPGSPQIRD